MRNSSVWTTALLAGALVLSTTGCDKLKARDHLNQGVSAFKNAKYADAIEHFKASLNIKADQPKVCNNLGVALTAIGQPLQGIAAFQQALQMDPHFADAEHNWGVALRKLGQSTEAIEHLKRAVELADDNPDYCNSLGQALLDTGHIEAAVQCLEMACQLDQHQDETDEAH